MPIIKKSGHQLSQNSHLSDPTSFSHDDHVRRSPDASMREEVQKELIHDSSAKEALTEPRKQVSNDQSREVVCTDRADLIERIKRGESATWVPNQAVSGHGI